MQHEREKRTPLLLVYRKRFLLQHNDMRSRTIIISILYKVQPITERPEYHKVVK